MVDFFLFLINIAKQLQTQIIVHYVDMRKWTVEENHAPNVVLYGPNCEFQNFIIFAFTIATMPARNARVSSGQVRHISPKKLFKFLSGFGVGWLNVFTMLLNLFPKLICPWGGRLVCWDEIVELKYCADKITNGHFIDSYCCWLSVKHWRWSIHRGSDEIPAALVAASVWGQFSAV